jgi:hypothetical protein
MFRFLKESRKKLTGNFNVDLHAIKHTKPFTLKARESLVVEQNVHTKQDEFLREKRCQTTMFNSMYIHIFVVGNAKNFLLQQF